MTDTQLTVTTQDGSPTAGMRQASPGMAHIEEHRAWPLLSRLPVVLTVQITLERFKVRDLLRLQEGQVLKSGWAQTSDVPLAVGGVRLGWSEFEMSGQQIGIRLTQLA